MWNPYTKHYKYKTQNFLFMIFFVDFVDQIVLVFTYIKNDTVNKSYQTSFCVLYFYKMKNDERKIIPNNPLETCYIAFS